MPSLHYAISFFKVSLLLQPAVPTFMDNRHILDNHDSGCYRDTHLLLDLDMSDVFTCLSRMHVILQIQKNIIYTYTWSE